MIWDANPIAISLLGLDIRWYGLVYALGFLFSEWYGWKRIKQITNLSRKQWESAILGVFLCGIIGGRLGEFIFFSPEVLISDPLEFFKIWHGGMAIQGGLIGSLLWLWYWSKKNKINPLLLTDALALPLAIVLISGRGANWMNGELWGRPTGTDWGVIFPHVDNLLRHPSQLYESAKNALLAAVIFLVERKLQPLKTEAKRKSRSRGIGISTTIFIAGYGILRFLIEYVKESEIIFIGLTTGQLLSLAMIIGAIILSWKLNFWRKKDSNEK